MATEAPPVQVSLHRAHAGLTLLAALLLGVGGELLRVTQGPASDAQFTAESLFFRFAAFILVLCVGRTAHTLSQAVIAGLLLSSGVMAGTVVVALILGRGLHQEPFSGGLPQILLGGVALPLAGIVLAFLSRLPGLRGDIAVAFLVQAQIIPAVLALRLLFSGSAECCTAVEWAYPWQDWGSVLLALILVFVLRPALAPRLRTLGFATLGSAVLFTLGSARGWM